MAAQAQESELWHTLVGLTATTVRRRLRWAAAGLAEVKGRCDNRLTCIAIERREAMGPMVEDGTEVGCGVEGSG